MVNGTTRAKRTTKTLSSSQPTPSTSRPSSRSGSKSRATSCKPSLGEWSLHEECQKKEIVTLNLDSILCANTDVFGSFGPARRALRDVSEAVVKAKRTVVISGAGISCSSGIPDFRSGDGLYSLVKERYPDQFVTGKDLFSSGLFNAPETTSLFYTFIAELSTSCLKAQPTRTHQFINRLNQKGKLLRSYTQNIDGLERRAGLESGGRGLGFKKMTTKNVEMHGDLGRVRCVLCMADFEARMDWMDLFKEGSAPWCPACEERSNGRIERSARALPIGTLRPSIVLYDENHPLGEQIGDLQVFDLFRKPDLLLIMGTSLKVHGLKRVVREFAKAVHAKKGLVVFVNLTPPSKEWEDVIDVHIQGETDKWVERVEEEWRHFRPGDWEVQTTLEAEVVKNPKSKVKGKPRAKSKTEPIQLPTPRPSQSPRRYDSSTFAMFDDDDLTPPPSSPLSSPPSSPRLAPLTPSKRRVNAVMTPVSDDEATRAKKRTTKPAAPVTGISATPGKGNLFTAITEDDDHWEDVINVKETSPSMQIPLERPVKAKGRAKAIIPLDKENTTPGLYAATFSPKAHRIYKTTSSDRSKRYEARVN